ncbi:MAG: hypothetical protein ACOYZ6_19180 [Chloroflexota bacterium]
MDNENTGKVTGVSVNGNMDGNIIVGNGNQITVSSSFQVDKTASELAIKRLTEEIAAIKNADVEVNKIKKEYYLTGQSSTLSVTIERGLVYVLANLRHKKPSDFLKLLNSHGFKESDLDAVLRSLTIPEIESLEIFFSEYLDNFKGEPSPAKKYAVKRIREDLARLIELENSKALLRQKTEELKKHREIVEKI